MSQIALPLAWSDDARDAEFIVTPANAAAVRHLERPATWPVMATIITGPRRSGRSLLGRTFAAKMGGRLIDNAERADEEAIFHAWNAAQATRRPLLIVADARPPAWRVMLPDLRSRLAATPAVAIEAPDDVLLAALLEKMLARRGIALPPELLRWLMVRMPRDYLAIERAVDLLDAAMLAGRRRATVPLAREALAPVIDLSHEEH